MTSRATTLAIMAALAPLFTAPVFAADLMPAEAAAELFFARPFSAMTKTIAGEIVTYRGDKDLGDADRSVLSVAPSAANPCLFEAFFVEAFPASPVNPPLMNGAYVASIDLRKPVRASIVSTPPSAGALSVSGSRLFCSRSIVFEPDLRMSYGEFCQDEITSSSDTLASRWRAALDVLRKACRWEN
jgi:hypothetical protein